VGGKNQNKCSIIITKHLRWALALGFTFKSGDLQI